MRIAGKHVKNIKDGVAAPNDGDLLQYNATDGLWETSPASDTFVATMDNAAAPVTVVVRRHGKLVTLEIPAISTTDGGGGAISSGATDIPAAYRPAADVSFAVVVTSNAAKVFGRLVVKASGQLAFTASAAGGAFTDNAAAGADRLAVTYSLA